MSNLQLDWTEQELLASHPIEEPLYAGVQLAHGGFDTNGEYVSPRTLGRWEAIHNWQQHHCEVFETNILDAPLSQWPKPYPNVAQSKYLLREGITHPAAAMFTRIGTVEGFGGLIREVGIGALQRHFSDDISGTALAHLELGLFEAHARDEVGFEDVAGHKAMWFAARDLAFDHSYTPDEVAPILQRMGIGGGNAAAPAAPVPVRLCPEIDGGLEAMLRFMIGLMFIEVSAFHVFAWAEELLSDDQLVADGGMSAKLVNYIRADEAPHVAYLQTALTEVRDRTMRATSGATIAGSEIIQRMWDHALAEQLGPRREVLRDSTLREVAIGLDGNWRGAEILEQFHALATPPL